ncbi:MAG: FAD-dependent monooxygenase [Anaerolineae bacterium]|nr:NAD(P)/FAD-dependent oxidoreductase [Anaerolineae bacterium]MDW8102908.1 FAD-dependent monooxygenase [Anaerolineae bacterium]
MGKVVHIVGASTAGLYAAYRLARKGAKVHLYEAESFLNPAPRTLILTSYFLQVLDFPPDETILNRVWQFELISANSSTTVTLKKPDLVVERRKLISLLLQKAMEAGVNFHWGYRLKEMEAEKKGFLLRFETERGEEAVSSFALVGADGTESLVARSLRCRSLPIVAVIQAKVNFPKPVSGEKVRVWFDRDKTRFFLWLIPESPHTGVVGLAADEMEEARKVLTEFLSSHAWEPDNFQSAFVPLYLPGTEIMGRCGADRVILVGDAAGHMKNTTVGGVVAGLRAASAIALTFDGRVEPGEKWRALKRELSLHAWLRCLLDTFSNEDYDRLLGLLNHRSLRVLATYSRDEFVRALIPFLFSQPQWFYLGARALLKYLVSRHGDKRPSFTAHQRVGH